MRLVMTVVALVTIVAAHAEAVPVLQLDMRGGIYDPATETIVAPSGAFELFAILTPGNGSTQTQINALLNTVYYISIALTPPIGPAGADLGSFSFGQSGSVNNYTATNGLTYGTPPVEQLAAKKDAGDLPGHGIYPTYFAEFAFTFSPLNRALTYNTAITPGGPTPSPLGGSYYASFVGNTTLLANNYQLHFDLYDAVAGQCANTAGCTDIDVGRFAPFSHDAGTYRVSEPTAAGFLVFGCAAGVAYGFRRVRARRAA